MKDSQAVFVLLTYNHARYVQEAIKGALSQTYVPLDIIISDDCSQDGTFDIITEELATYRGPHKIMLTRNEKNLGITRHINKIMDITKAQLIVAAAGDDISQPNRTLRIVEIWGEGKGALVIGCNPTVIDDKGKYQGLLFRKGYSPDFSLEEIVRRGNTGFFLTAWDRLIFDRFGPLPTNASFEDQLIPFWGAMLGRNAVCFLDEPLVQYRRHSSSISASWRINGCSNDEWSSYAMKGIDASMNKYSSWKNTLNMNWKILGDNAPYLIEYVSVQIEALQILKKLLVEKNIFKRLSIVIKWRSHVRGVSKKQLARIMITAISPWLWVQIKKRREVF
jgi:glycosyltransferase involved in cell wall biosynthesis